MSLTRRKFIAAGAGAVAAVLLPAVVTGHHRPGHGGPKPTPTPTPIPTPAPTPAPAGVRYGTLMTDSSRSVSEYAAGLRYAHLEAFWDRIETADNVWSSSELAWKVTERDRHLAAGMKLVLEPGIHYAPSYVSALPNGRYVSNIGTQAGRNVIWSPAVRSRVERYIRQLAATLDFSRFDAIRLGGAGEAETLYPSGSLFWGYDSTAQSSCPYPGWKPGDTSLSPAQVDEWYGWYLDAMIGEISWRMGLFRSLGFTGTFHLVMPGIGAVPVIALEAIQNRLTLYADVMGRGAAWWLLLGRLVADVGTDRLVVWCSSTAEGYRQTDYTQGGDAAVDPLSQTLRDWSSMRLMTYYANRLGLGKGGENPGFGDSTGYGLAMLNAAVAQVKAGAWSSFGWAHDHNLYDGTGPTLAQYSAAIS